MSIADQLLLFKETIHAPTGSPVECSSLAGPCPVPLSVCVLGSGSSGNSTAVRLGNATMLIDAGFGPRATAKRLDGTGLDVADIRAVCLTHLDRDHLSPNWLAFLLRKSIKLYVHSRHVQSLYRIDGARLLHKAGLLQPVHDQAFEPIDGLHTRGVTLPHDRKGTMGLLLESAAGRIGYATDLGRVPDELIERFVGVDLLAIESNYDPRMQLLSARPAMLKQRIMGGHGHLSNQQAFEAVRRIVDRCPRGGPRHVVLLHRSRQCNSPEMVMKTFAQDRRLSHRLHLAEQHDRTGWLTVARG